MRKPHLSTVIILTLLACAANISGIAWAATAIYTPPAEPGLIYTVINYSRSAGRAQHTYVTVDWGTVHRRQIVPFPYSNSSCATSTPSGFVFRLRHNQPDSTPLKITTTGTIVRGPYQGDVPLELLHPCYKLVK
jgi:hypothetical protein